MRASDRQIGIGLVVVFAAALGAGATALGAGEYDYEPIRYESTPVNDPVSALGRRIERGEAALGFDERHGYLPAVLEALGVPRASQMLVFSKTSFQLQHIGPTRPRAGYFSDDVYIGWVQGGDVLEISAVDPKQGAIFYTLDQKPTARPQFVRRNECMQCHSSAMTQSVPGHLVRSVYTDERGHPLLHFGTSVTTHRSAVEERWGGWYVTGTSGRNEHRGNLVVKEGQTLDDLDLRAGTNVKDLSTYFDTSKYLTPHSDIVALLVIEHQAHMHNLITRANYQTRIALHEQAEINAMRGRPADEMLDSTRRRIERHGEALLRYMLFLDEAYLAGPIAGTTKFAEQFQAQGVRDAQGRSLRDLDLGKWLFEYPCSYLIYSEAWDGMPEPMKAYMYRRLWAVLSGADDDPAYRVLSTADRAAIIEILRETKRDLPDYWRAAKP